MNNEVFFSILTSWEVIVAIVAFIIILPLTLYIASYDRNAAIDFIRIKKKKKKPGKKAVSEEKQGKKTKNDHEEQEEIDEKDTQDRKTQKDKAREKKEREIDERVDFLRKMRNKKKE